MKSLKKNILYNMSLQFFNIIFPFLVGAYISRTLGAKNLGEVNFSQSILIWINIVTSLGIPTYGIREIAINRNSRIKTKRIFSELIVLRGIITLIIVVLYYICIFYIPIFKRQLLLFSLTGLGILFNLFNVDWYFSGIEEYKTLSLRTIIVKVITFIFIIILIKNQENYILYAFLLILSQGISNIWSFLYSLKSTKFTVKKINYLKHLKKIKFFLLSALITSVYTTLNTIILGFLDNSQGVAYFVRARQIQGIGIAVTGAIATVLVPRISYYYHSDKENYKKLLNISLNYNYIISVPLTIVLSVLAGPLNIFLGGNEFIKATLPLIILSPTIIIISMGTWMYFQIIIPSGKEKSGTVIQLLMATTNFILNIFLIRKLGYVGASISLLVTEGLGTILLYVYSKKIQNINIVTKSLPKYIFSTFIIVVLIKLLEIKLNGLFLLLMSSVIGIITYGILLVILKEEIVYGYYKQIKKS